MDAARRDQRQRSGNGPGAILFHLFTPLGVAVVNTDGTSDGGLLFGMAVSVWISCAMLLWLSRGEILGLLRGARG